MTNMLHGSAETEAARAAARALFTGEVRGLDSQTLAAIADDLGAVEWSKDRLIGSEVPSVGTLLKELGLASSKRELREFIKSGAARVKVEGAGRLMRRHRARNLRGRRGGHCASPRAFSRPGTIRSPRRPDVSDDFYVDMPTST